LGVDAGPLVVAGHSAGGHLAALAALAPDRFGADCPYPAVPADGLVGLAGVYDVTQATEVAVSLFGTDPDADAARWSAGNPVTYVGDRPDLPVLLLHGSADPLVPLSMTRDMAAALRAGEHEVSVEIVEGADHATVYQADSAGPPILDWIAATWPNRSAS
jgi:acetyl esterase/lipase